MWRDLWRRLTATADARAAASWPYLLAALGIAFFIDLSSDTPGWGPFYRVTHASQTTSALVAGALVLTAGWCLLRPRLVVWPAWDEVLTRLLPVGTAVMALLWTRPLIHKSQALPWNLFVAGSLALLVLLALLRAPGVLVMIGAFVIGTAVRLVHWDHFSINVGADMLPLVTSAVRRLLSGESPYGTYMLPDAVPLTYLPLTTLAYLPPVVLNIDARWTNWVAELAIPAALLFAGRRTRWRWSSDLALIVWGAVFLTPSSIYFDRITTAPVAWATLTWALVLVATGSRGAWIGVGLAAAATPLLATFLPLCWVAWWRQGGARKVLLSTAGAALLALLFILPFFLWAPRAYVEGTWLWFNDLDRFPRSKWSAFQTWQRYVGFSGLFWRTENERWLKPLQALAILLTTALYAWRRDPPRHLPAYGAFAFTAFMVVNPVLWPYFYQPALLAAIAALAVTATWRPRDGAAAAAML